MDNRPFCEGTPDSYSIVNVMNLLPLRYLSGAIKELVCLTFLHEFVTRVTSFLIIFQIFNTQKILFSTSLEVTILPISLLVSPFRLTIVGEPSIYLVMDQ